MLRCCSSVLLLGVDMLRCCSSSVLALGAVAAGQPCAMQGISVASQYDRKARQCSMYARQAELKNRYGAAPF